MGILDLNTIKEALQISGRIEFYPQILEAQEKLLEQQKKIIDLEVENRNLKDKLNIKKNLVHCAEAYYTINDGKEDGPFCMRCYDVDSKLVRLNRPGQSGHAYCSGCGKYFSPR